MNHVTVITLTRRRPLLVQRAIRSVQAQKTQYALNHLVLIDDCPETLAVLEPLGPSWSNLEIIYMPREPHEVSGPGRSSRLRNIGVQRAVGNWIAFLDDDNEWLEDHIESLVTCALANQARAVHCQVRLLNPDGTPYLEPRWPWAQSKVEAERMYWEYVEKGVCIPGSNILGLLRDRTNPIEPSADTSAWLLARRLLLEVPFEEYFSESDARDFVGEDDKLLMALVKRREPIGCTRQATLKYYLGGYSNNPSGVVDASFSWATKGESE